jgi:hypothetical protein
MTVTWREKDEQQELTHHNIIALVSRHGNENEDNDTGTGEAELQVGNIKRMSHSKKIKAPEAALAFTEQLLLMSRY